MYIFLCNNPSTFTPIAHLSNKSCNISKVGHGFYMWAATFMIFIQSTTAGTGTKYTLDSNLFVPVSHLWVIFLKPGL